MHCIQFSFRNVSCISSKVNCQYEKIYNCNWVTRNPRIAFIFHVLYRIADIPLPSSFTFLFSSWNFSHHFSALSLAACRMLVEMRYTSYPGVVNEVKINTAHHSLSAYFLSHSIASQCNIALQPFLPVWESWTHWNGPIMESFPF